ncbi:MAG: hypothetical protein ACK5JH_07730 [Anaerocolumna sp.]
MFDFEFKRLIRNKDIFVIIISMMLLVVTNLVLENVYYGEQINSNIRLYNLYNTFSQFIFLVFAPIFGGIISKDIENNSIYFYLNNNVNMKKYCISKLISYQLVIFIVFSMQFAIYALVFNIDFYKAIAIFIILLLDFYYLLSIAFLLSCIMKKHSKTSIMIIFTWFVLSLVNIIPFPLIRGKIFLIDNNSYTSYIISNYLGLFEKSINFKEPLNIGNNNLFVLFLVNMIWIIIFNLISYMLLLKKYNRVIKRRNNVIKYN